MKKNNLKKILSVAAVLAITVTAAASAISFSGCDKENDKAEAPEKLISEDKNHSAHFVSTANGTIRTQSSGKVYYVAPDGKSGNTGESWESPLPIVDLISANLGIVLQPGDTIYVKPGTYSISSMVTVPNTVKGAYNKYIRIVNAALEEESGYTGSEKLATLDFSSQFFASTSRGVQIYGDYIYWYGIDVCGAGDNGLYIGGSYNTVEYCEFYNNRDTGLQLGRAESTLSSIEQWPSYNLVKNCTSHNNYDNETYGENADGFAAKLTVGYGNVFDGCIAYRNSDDGWDLYAKSDSGNIGCVIIYNCVAFENGYLEYTQAQNNARFPNYNKDYNEVFENSDIRYFRTRDGDGNGFKLGGSAMEGDVVMYNCLSYWNRMHGVTDNSNPGYLKVEGVTSYDNSAVVDENPESATFGQIVSGKVNYEQDTHGNINVSRQTWSYNSVINTLSVKGDTGSYLEGDEYRGSVTDSMLLGSKQNVIVGNLDAQSKLGGNNAATETRELLNASDVFVKLPFDGTNYNLSGLNDLYAEGTSGALKSDRVHISYRNPDGSINMKEILAKKDGVDDSLLISGKSIGSTLNKTEWNSYTHFFAKDFVNEAATAEAVAKVERAKETLTINTDPNAVYQDFEVPTRMKDVTITWTSSDKNLLDVKKNADGSMYVEDSLSTSQYITFLVYRPLNADETVKLTATITCGAATETKEFNLTIKCGTPKIGEIYVVTRGGEVIEANSSMIIDQYSVFPEPEIKVENGLDYNGKLLTDAQFTKTTKYMYAADKSSPFVEIAGFTPSNSGVYQITHTVTLAGDGSKATMTYTLYVANPSGRVDFDGTASVIANRDGYLISGSLTNATGYIYAVSLPNGAEKPTKDTIKTFNGVEAYSFRNDTVKFQFNNDNSDAYTVYYALGNLNGEVTSEVYEQKIETVDISTPEQFATIANGGIIGSENPTTTIYRLTQDLDFSDIAYAAPTKAFTGLFNGACHTISNITVSGAKNVGVFYRVTGGTVENVKFNNISITASDKPSGLIASSYGGYFHNIAVTNINIAGSERTGGLIGQVFESAIDTHISQVSIVNDDSHVISSGNSHRAGGLVGFIQPTSGLEGGKNIHLYISDCYVITKVSGSQQIGGFVGSFDNQNGVADYLLDITRCYFGGSAWSTYGTPRVGGFVGYQPGAYGTLRITNCISIGRLYNKEIEITASLKTASLIFGGFSSTAANVVTGCIASMEEYNSDYNVETYTKTNLENGIAAIENLLGAGYEDKWEFVYQEGSTSKLAAPYLTLKFLK